MVFREGLAAHGTMKGTNILVTTEMVVSTFYFKAMLRLYLPSNKTLSYTVCNMSTNKADPMLSVRVMLNLTDNTWYKIIEYHCTERKSGTNHLIGKE